MSAERGRISWSNNDVLLNAARSVAKAGMRSNAFPDCLELQITKLQRTTAFEARDGTSTSSAQVFQGNVVKSFRFLDLESGGAYRKEECQSCHHQSASMFIC